MRTPRVPPLFTAILGSFFGRREGGPDTFCFVSNACFKISQNIHYLVVFGEQVGHCSQHGYEETKVRDQKAKDTCWLLMQLGPNRKLIVLQLGGGCRFLS